MIRYQRYTVCDQIMSNGDEVWRAVYTLRVLGLRIFRIEGQPYVLYLPF